MSQQKITYNGQALFGEGLQTVNPLSWRREQAERGFGGLNGVFSVDLGRRERQLKQRGQLSAGTVKALRDQIETISESISGQGGTLTDQDGIIYANVRMDRFTILKPIAAANQARCEYEILYTQLSK